MEFKKRVIRKPVAFNTQDVEQKKLLEYALSLDNFSGHMKRLLAEDFKKHQRLMQLSREIDQYPSNYLKNQGGIRIDLTSNYVNDDSSSTTDEKTS